MKVTDCSALYLVVPIVEHGVEFLFPYALPLPGLSNVNMLHGIIQVANQSKVLCNSKITVKIHAFLQLFFLP